MTVTVFGQKTGLKPQVASYTLDFVYTGEVQNVIDSVFVLQYTFASADVHLFTNLVLEDSQGQYSLNIGKTGFQGEMEVKKEKDKVKVIIHKYDKFDLPVLTHAEDKLGDRHPLYLSAKYGGRVSAEQFKAQIKGIRDVEIQRSNAGDKN
jgi:hypothetical protein